MTIYPVRNLQINILDNNNKSARGVYYNLQQNTALRPICITYISSIINFCRLRGFQISFLSLKHVHMISIKVQKISAKANKSQLFFT